METHQNDQPDRQPPPRPVNQYPHRMGPKPPPLFPLGRPKIGNPRSVAEMNDPFFGLSESQKEEMKQAIEEVEREEEARKHDHLLDGCQLCKMADPEHREKLRVEEERQKAEVEKYLGRYFIEDISRKFRS